MKRALTIFFCSLFFLESVFPRIDFADFCQVPELLAHFEKHQSESPGITFMEFVYLHYGNSTHLQQDAKSHQKLPFSHTHHIIAKLQLPPDFSVFIPSHDFAFIREIEDVLYRKNHIPTVFNSIWQPPKI